MNLTFLLNLLKVVGSTISQAPQFIALYHEAVATLHPADQATAKAALADIQAANDAGHAALQAKLAAAAKF